MPEATPEAGGKHRGPGGHCKEGPDQKGLWEAGGSSAQSRLAACGCSPGPGFCCSINYISLILRDIKILKGS